jgi:hypothetical protein
MPLEKLQVSLFGALPLGNGLERVDIPTNERSQGNLRLTLLSALDCFGELRLVLELYFAMPCPGDRGRTMRKRLGLPIDHGCATTDTDHGRMPCISRALFPREDVRHGSLPATF